MIRRILKRNSRLRSLIGNNLASCRPRKISEFDFSGSRKSGGFSRRSQEEMVGFVLIVVLVTVIALVFLAINMNKPAQKLPSAETESFIQSAMRYSTECYSSAENVYDIKDLIKACSDSEICLNNKLSCDVLNDTLYGLFKESWRPGINNSVKAYSLKITRDNRTIISLKEGVASGTKSGSSVIITSDIMVYFDRYT